VIGSVAFCLCFVLQYQNFLRTFLRTLVATGKVRFKHKPTSQIHPKENVIYLAVNAILLLITINNWQDAISLFFFWCS